MELTLVWMYHNIMDLYGDKGNVMVLRKRCADRGIKLNVISVGVGETYDLKQADILFIGGGADKEQGVMYNDLLSRKDNIKAAMDSGINLLLICGGYQLFGQYYEDKDGNRLEGLKIFDYYTIAKPAYRSIGNIIVEAFINEQKITLCGFENHGGLTYNVSQPLGRVISGNGNNELDNYEGYFDGQTIATYLHGPLLPKNVELADYLIQCALKRHGIDTPLAPLDDELSILAKNYMIKKILSK